MEFTQNKKISFWNYPWKTRCAILSTEEVWWRRKLESPSEEIERMKNQHTQVNAEQNEYEEYFQYAQTELSIPTPNSANEALALFISLLNIANFGS